jgi:hypothetical protein
MIISQSYLRMLPCCIPAPGLLAAACIIVLSGTAVAQTPPATGGGQSGGTTQSTGKTTAIEDKLVTIDVENARLADVLPDLMKSVGADYSLDGGIKNAHVTIHIAQAKFKPTLDTMMKVCDTAVTYRVEQGLYHFMALADAPPLPQAPVAPGRSTAPARPGPRYNGGDPLAVAVSELFQFLSGCEPAFSGKGPYPNNGSLKAGSGSLSGSRNYSEYGFLNGTLSSSSYSTPDISNPQSSTYGTGYGYFGPIGRGNGVIR